MLTVLLILLHLTFQIKSQNIHPVLPPPTELSCPTVGTNAYILVTVTPETDIRQFEDLLNSYGRLMPFNSTQQIKYDFYFGSNYSTIVTTNDLIKEISVSF